MPSSLSRTHAQRRAAQRLAHLGRSVQRRASGDPLRGVRPPAAPLPPRLAHPLAAPGLSSLPLLAELPELPAPVWPSIGELAPSPAASAAGEGRGGGQP